MTLAITLILAGVMVLPLLIFYGLFVRERAEETATNKEEANNP